MTKHYRGREAPITRCGRAMLTPQGRVRETTWSTGTVQKQNTTRDWDEVTCNDCLKHKPETAWERLTND